MKRLFLVCLMGLWALVGCGGGGGGSAAGCTPENGGLFFEVADSSSCTSNLIGQVDFGGGFAFSDGGSGGGDGGGGDGGGAGAGDLRIALQRFLQQWLPRTVYALLGIQAAQADAISACGTGVAQSDLNKLTSTGWQYVPLVKAGTAAGTACVKRIFDANQHLAVYASGLEKAGKTCYLVMVEKATGKTRCFSSTETITLSDDNGSATWYTDYMTPSLFAAASTDMSANKLYFGVMFKTASGRLLGARMDVSNASSLTSHLAFDSSSLTSRSEWNGLYPFFQKMLALNDGALVVHMSNLNADYALRKDYTYLSTESTRSNPAVANANLYKNPQCLVQDPGLNKDAQFLGTYARASNGDIHDLVRWDATNGITTVQADTGACLQSNNAAVAVRNASTGNAGRLYQFFPRSVNSGPYNIAVSYIDLANGSEHDAFTVNAPSNVSCNGSNQSLDLNQASLTLLDDQSKFVLAARTATTFNSMGAITAGGLSTLVRYNMNHSLDTTLIPYSSCTTIRKFEKSASTGNFATATEPYGQGTSPSLSQTTRLYDASMTPGFSYSQTGQHFKLGATLNPL